MVCQSYEYQNWNSWERNEKETLKDGKTEITIYIFMLTIQMSQKKKKLDENLSEIKEFLEELTEN